MAKIVSIHSFRGGTGKSNVAANLACALARDGHRVAIVDTDIQSPGVHALFGAEPDGLQPTLNGFLWGECTMSDAAHDVTSRVQDGPPPTWGTVYLVPASMKTGDIARALREGYDVARLNDGFQDLAVGRALDFVIVDTHPGVNEETLLSIAVSDDLLLVLRPDRQDFQGMAVTVELARRLGTSRILLLLNKVPPDVDTDVLRQRVERIYEAPVVAVFPLSVEVAQAGSEGVFCLKYPDHPFSHEMTQLARQVSES